MSIHACENENCGLVFERGRGGHQRRYCGHCRAEVAVVRTTSSPSVLAARLSGVATAWKSGDETAAREELRELAAEAALLSRTIPLFRDPTAVQQRQRISAEREPGGRIS